MILKTPKTMRTTHKVGSLDETKEKPNNNQAGIVLCARGAGGNNTPCHHGAGEVDGRLSEFVQQQVGGDCMVRQRLLESRGVESTHSASTNNPQTEY